MQSGEVQPHMSCDSVPMTFHIAHKSDKSLGMTLTVKDSSETADSFIHVIWTT